MMQSLDHESIVPGKVEETATLAWRAEFRKEDPGGQGDEIVGWIEME